MFSAAHILETALLLLVAFLVGCTIGHWSRRMSLARARTAAIAAAGQQATPPAAPLVSAPEIVPLASASDRLAVQRLMGTAGAAPAAGAAAIPAVSATAGPDASAVPQATSQLRPIRPAGETISPAPAAPAEPPVPIPPATAEITEAEAMRAVEGTWSPPSGPAPERAVALPESEPLSAASSGEAADAAMAGARAAVAAAGAAAAQVLAELAKPQDAAETEPSEVPIADDFAGAPPGRPHAAFGRPPGLAAPRNGAKDDLRRIKGISAATEAALNELGIFHFDQIAAWDRKAVVWVENRLASRGQVQRQRWCEQARGLGRRPLLS